MNGFLFWLELEASVRFRLVNMKGFALHERCGCKRVLVYKKILHPGVVGTTH